MSSLNTLWQSLTVPYAKTGRVTDASPVIAAALWWHGWDWSNYDALAGALLAGHCIVCLCLTPLEHTNLLAWIRSAARM